MLKCALAMLALFGVSMAATNAYAEPGTERAAGAHGATKDVVATAVEAGHFKTLVKALEAAGLVDTLKGKEDRSWAEGRCSARLRLRSYRQDRDPNQIGPVAGDLHDAACFEPNHDGSLAQQIYRLEDWCRGRRDVLRLLLPEPPTPVVEGGDRFARPIAEIGNSQA